jgi:two-component system response regulator MtrA
MKVLIALPDPAVCTSISIDLRHHGCATSTCFDGFQALSRWRVERPAMVLLHSDLAGIDGYGICRAIRAESRAPIVMVSPRTDDDSVERGFNAGVDDYVAASTGQRQLIARVVSMLSRRGRAAVDRPPVPDAILTTTLRIDLESHEVSRGQLTARLTPAEFGLLRLLAANEGKLVSTSRLMSGLGARGGQSRATIRSRVASIRRKLGMSEADLDDICSIRGRGYRLSRPLPAGPAIDGKPAVAAAPTGDQRSSAVARRYPMPERT